MTDDNIVDFPEKKPKPEWREVDFDKVNTVEDVIELMKYMRIKFMATPNSPIEKYLKEAENESDRDN